MSIDSPYGAAMEKATRLFYEEIEEHCSALKDLVADAGLGDSDKSKKLRKRLHKLRGGAGFLKLTDIENDVKQWQMRLDTLTISEEVDCPQLITLLEEILSHLQLYSNEDAR